MPFNRDFFEDFEDLVRQYSKREDCESPIVEILLQDTAKFEVKHINALGDGWVGLTIYDKTGCSTDMFVSFEQIARVIFYRDPQKSESIGFRC